MKGLKFHFVNEDYSKLNFQYLTGKISLKNHLNQVFKYDVIPLLVPLV